MWKKLTAAVIVLGVTLAGALIGLSYLPGSSPLHQAAARDWPVVVKALLFIGFDPNKKVYAFKSSQPTTPLEAASKHGAVSTVRVLITQGADPSLGRGAFFAAASQGQADVVLTLLRLGVDPNIRSTCCNAPALFMVINARCQMEPNIRIIRLLLEHGADPNLREPLNQTQTDMGFTDGQTPLYDALFNDCPKVAELLIGYGADPAATVYGRTPLEHLRSEVWPFKFNKRKGELEPLLQKALNLRTGSPRFSGSAG